MRRPWSSRWGLTAALVAGLAGACTADSVSCGPGYCVAPLVCISTVGCCADPAWLATLDAGVVEDLLAALERDGGAGDGGADGGTPVTCVPLAR